MTLPFGPPLEPMLAKLSRELPVGDLLYEPKWDGFRCVVFRDGDEVVLQSRNGKPLERYFPEMLDPIRAQLPARAILDGELVVPVDDGIDFDAISERIHPAASRVAMLAEATPARFIAFDLLALDDLDLRPLPMRRRRDALAELAERWSAPLHLTPATLDPAVAADWFARFEGAGLDGVVAKPLGDAYAPGKRTLLKVKHERTTDVVVAGYRLHKDGEGVGSLLLGLFHEGELHHVGVAASFAAADRRALRERLEPLAEPDTHPWGAWTDNAGQWRGNRWNATKDMSFTAIELQVAEVAFEQVQHGRFRHNARFRRWRPDRDPASCLLDQIEVATPFELLAVLRA